MDSANLNTIQTKIVEVRGMRVMLDSDLAGLYQVQTKVLNQTFKRNIRRFPSDFAFQLTQDEWDRLRSQIVTSNDTRGGRRYLPYVFTEHGTLMLASILKSNIAIHVNTLIIRAFISLRNNCCSNLNDQDLKHDIFRLERHIHHISDAIQLQHKLDTAMQNQKIQQLSEQVGQLSRILDEFQNAHVVIQRPEDEGLG